MTSLRVALPEAEPETEPGCQRPVPARLRAAAGPWAQGARVLAGSAERGQLSDGQWDVRAPCMAKGCADVHWLSVDTLEWLGVPGRLTRDFGSLAAGHALRISANGL